MIPWCWMDQSPFESFTAHVSLSGLVWLISQDGGGSSKRLYFLLFWDGWDALGIGTAFARNEVLGDAEDGVPMISSFFQ